MLQLQLLRSPWATIAGHRVLLFDAGATIAAAGILVTFLVSAARNTVTLYRMEPMNPAGRQDARVPAAERRNTSAVPLATLAP